MAGGDPRPVDAWPIETRGLPEGVPPRIVMPRAVMEERLAETNARLARMSEPPLKMVEMLVFPPPGLKPCSTSSRALPVALLAVDPRSSPGGDSLLECCRLTPRCPRCQTPIEAVHLDYEVP